MNETKVISKLIELSKRYDIPVEIIEEIYDVYVAINQTHEVDDFYRQVGYITDNENLKNEISDFVCNEIL